MSTLLHSRDSTQHDDIWTGFKMWHYTPSIPASIIFTILFTTLTTTHTYLLLKRRTHFCIPFVIGGLFEVIGYIARAAAHNATNSVTLYALQNLALLLAPILFAASIYMVLGRVIRGVKGEGHSVIRVTWLTKIFVGCDVICFLAQCTGGGMLAAANTKKQIDLCNDIVLAGLIFQIVVFGLFVVAAVVFHVRMGRRPTEAALSGPLGVDSRVGACAGGRWMLVGRKMAGWKRLMVVLYVTSALITLRNLFRVVEYGMGWDSYLLNHEWVLLAFDAVLMVGVLVICVVCYDPEISKRKKKVEQQKSGDEMAIIESGDGEGGSKGAARAEGQGTGPWS